MLQLSACLGVGSNSKGSANQYSSPRGLTNLLLLETLGDLFDEHHHSREGQQGRDPGGAGPAQGPEPGTEYLYRELNTSGLLPSAGGK